MSRMTEVDWSWCALDGVPVHVATTRGTFLDVVLRPLAARVEYAGRHYAVSARLLPGGGVAWGIMVPTAHVGLPASM